ncbi:hypothetical protein AJ79_00319 [Helicocarpus griseus UAMH5409]|uniref:tRNA ligase n=1 Tax=Helicocarpus griseus UAMH5409 TaxID=1447875 RepID=A0A2B7YBG9_9EURO|nr:hypothetical protein AJ79_00319 [Helicocarpus griseus UAMH5409]
MVQQDVQEVTQLVHSLEAASNKKKQPGKKTFSCKKSTFPVAGSDNISVDSWRFQDWDYKRDDMPTYARGLFTTINRNNQHEIAVRGYDKFFNVEEVNLTRWRNIENNTKGPYELSVKENGCIIFMSGLEDGTLLVCSKHSTGVRADAAVSHAVAGENWAKQHVASVGKTVEDLARALRSANLTAVGELCDDCFEEHVLAYNEEAAGIYLHGLNYNLPEFATLPGPKVHRFADEWGFKKAQYLMKDSLPEVKCFLERCAETGSWDGRDTEGFVIRCQMREGNVGPYRDWFFKYKFEEPYLMYRQWREATKAMIGGRQPKIKKHVKITEEYLQYAKKRLIDNPQLAKQYNLNHGIIAMRDGFLKERGLKGSEIIAMESAQGESTSSNANVTQDIVLVPVASIGCGKTTLALGLVKLFGWGHVQNDNIQGQKNRPKRFAQEVNNALATHRVVIADRNNHQRRERKQIIDDVQRVIPNAKFVALHYVHEPKQVLLNDIRQVTQGRVLERGDNHQTIQASTKGRDSLIAIMEGFLHRFEAVNTDYDADYGFDEVIDLDVTASSRENLEKVVSALHSSFPKLMNGQMPTSHDLDNAIDEAMKNYTVDTKHDLSFGNNRSSKPAVRENPDQLVKRIEYFNISLKPFEINNLLTSLFPPSTYPPEKAKLYKHLQNSRRIQPSFHVTLIHRASQQAHPDIWSHYTNLYKNVIQPQPDSTNDYALETPTLGTARVRIERLVWDDRIMAFVVRISPQGEESWPCANEIPHITVGTASPGVKPKESNDLLKRWLEVGASEETGIWEIEVPSVIVYEGSVGEVMRR